MSVAVALPQVTLHKQEIEDLIRSNELQRAHNRVLDFVNDFGGKSESRREALILGMELTGLREEERKFGSSEETRRRRVIYCERILQIAESVYNSPDIPSVTTGRRRAKANETPTLHVTSGEDAAPGGEPMLRKSAGPSIKLIQVPKKSGGTQEEPSHVPFDEAKKRFSDDRHGKAPDGSVAFFADKLSKRYRRSFGFELRDVSLELRPAEITGVVGVNGAGKTTLLRIVAGDLLADSGRYSYPLLQSDASTQKDLDWPLIRRQIAYVQQRPARWFGRLANSLHRVAADQGFYGQKNIDEVDFILQRLGLERYRDAKWGQISGGYKMRFELAKALVSCPKLLVLDEPLAPLDIVTQQLFLQDLRDISRSSRRPLTIIISSQHLYEIEAVADRVIFIEEGDALFYGKVEDIGADRIENAFEIGCEVTLPELRALIEKLQADCQQTAHALFLVKVPRAVSGPDILSVFLSKKVAVTYFRDVSRSTRTLFKGVEETI